MTIIRHIHTRMALLALLGVIAIGTGAALAATRTTTVKPIGTGVVVIDTTLAYEGGEAAGTGMVLTANGEVITNNHVIEGATSITVVVPGTTRTYTARVLGYDVADDVAVLKLISASNLKTISASTAPVAVGQKVTAIGNAGGTGTLASATGSITGLGKTITAADGNGSSEQLMGLIETNANVQPGDSGGPLVTSAGKVIGMDTAGSTSGGGPFAGYETTTDAYAIPIGRAVAIAGKIVAGKSSATIHVGATAFLGIQVSTSYGYGATPGAVVAGVVSGGPAANARLTPGDVITAIAGKGVASPNDVQAIVLTKKPGDKVAVTYLDQSGQSQTTTVTLGSGAAQ
jgi:S1-C subfamily serine protease